MKTQLILFLVSSLFIIVFLVYFLIRLCLTVQQNKGNDSAKIYFSLFLLVFSYFILWFYKNLYLLGVL